MRFGMEAEAPVRVESAPAAVEPTPTVSDRLYALLEVLICSGFPTQVAIGTMFAAIGFRPGPQIEIGYVVGVSLLDSAVLIALVIALMKRRGQRPREILLGHRRPVAEALAGIPLIVVAFSLAVLVLAGILMFAPSLHDVDENPLQSLLRGPLEVLLFAVVAVVAGGVREEIQRAFLLNRFEGWLGGGKVGVVVASTAFGAGHLLQGTDAAIATGVLGAFWAMVYLRRRSVLAPIVSHSGFNLLQLVQFIVLGR